MILWEKHVLNDVQLGEFGLIFCETGSKKSTRMIVWCLTPPAVRPRVSITPDQCDLFMTPELPLLLLKRIELIL